MAWAALTTSYGAVSSVKGFLAKNSEDVGCFNDRNAIVCWKNKSECLNMEPTSKQQEWTMCCELLFLNLILDSILNL